MKIKDYKCENCGSDNLKFLNRDSQVGIYCKKCGRFLKWADDEEKELCPFYALKINRRTFMVSNEDNVIFNGSVYVLNTQKYRDRYTEISPTIPITTAKKLIKAGILVKTDKIYRNCFGEINPKVTVFQFNIDKDTAEK